MAVSWLREGPKIADVTEEQYQALSKVEVRLELADFTMPYPTVLVNLPDGKLHDFIIIHKRDIRATNGDPIPLLMSALTCLLPRLMTLPQRTSKVNRIHPTPTEETERLTCPYLDRRVKNYLS